MIFKNKCTFCAVRLPYPHNQCMPCIILFYEMGKKK